MLANISWDLQIGICMFLQPFDILALRKTCKALQPCTRQRVVWITALHRVCLDNALFLPSFPISEMNDLELEKAAMGPRRWIELCSAIEKRHLNGSGAVLHPRVTRIVYHSFATEDGYATSKFFFVPGGRFLVISSSSAISVLDLGYTSSNDVKLIASIGREGGSELNTLNVRATPDGMGLVIFSSDQYETCSIYEIYPQSETSQLTEIAQLDYDIDEDSPSILIGQLSPTTVIWYSFYEDRIVFRVWDYRQNHSVNFSVDIQIDKYEFDFEVLGTDIAVIVLCEEAVFVWAIPPLLPQPLDFYNCDPTLIPPLFTFPFPDGFAPHSEFGEWITVSHWYFGSPQHLYFDMLCQDSKLHRFQIMLKPDLSTASLHVINTPERTPHDFTYVRFKSYKVCEDTLVSCWVYTDGDPGGQYQCGVYTGLTSARFADVIPHGGSASKMLFPDIGREYLLFSCPESGRFVLMKSNNSVTVVDLFS